MRGGFGPFHNFIMNILQLSGHSSWQRKFLSFQLVVSCQQSQWNAKNLHSNANDLTNHQHSTSLSSLVIHKTYKQNADNYEGPKGRRLEVGARRAPKLLVSEYFPRDHLQSISLCSVGILGDRFVLALCAELRKDSASPISRITCWWSSGWFLRLPRRLLRSSVQIFDQPTSKSSVILVANFRRNFCINGATLSAEQVWLSGSLIVMIERAQGPLNLLSVS